MPWRSDSRYDWSPNQMWLNGMMNAENPLAYDELDDTPDDLNFYGYDPNGPSPVEDSDINVIVSPIYHNETTAEILTILQTVDPFRPSTEMGIDVSWCSWFSWKHAERAEGMNRHFAKQVEHVVVKLSFVAEHRNSYYIYCIFLLQNATSPSLSFRKYNTIVYLSSLWHHKTNRYARRTYICEKCWHTCSLIHGCFCVTVVEVDNGMSVIA